MQACARAPPPGRRSPPVGLTRRRCESRWRSGPWLDRFLLYDLVLRLVHLCTGGGEAASSTITVTRSRTSRLAGTWWVGSARAAAIASALPAPVASSRQRRADRSTARLRVIRSGGGLGESWTPRQIACSPASSVGAPGNSEATWPSGRRPSG